VQEVVEVPNPGSVVEVALILEKEVVVEEVAWVQKSPKMVEEEAKVNYLN
jgi:hypothetical protein